MLNLFSFTLVNLNEKCKIQIVNKKFAGGFVLRADWRRLICIYRSKTYFFIRTDINGLHVEFPGGFIVVAFFLLCSFCSSIIKMLTIKGKSCFICLAVYYLTLSFGFYKLFAKWFQLLYDLITTFRMILLLSLPWV